MKAIQRVNNYRSKTNKANKNSETKKQNKMESKKKNAKAKFSVQGNKQHAHLNSKQMQIIDEIPCNSINDSYTTNQIEEHIEYKIKERLSNIQQDINIQMQNSIEKMLLKFENKIKTLIRTSMEKCKNETNNMNDD